MKALISFKFCTVFWPYEINHSDHLILCHHVISIMLKFLYLILNPNNVNCGKMVTESISISVLFLFLFFLIFKH